MKKLKSNFGDAIHHENHVQIRVSNVQMSVYPMITISPNSVFVYDVHAKRRIVCFSISQSRGYWSYDDRTD